MIAAQGSPAEEEDFQNEEEVGESEIEDDTSTDSMALSGESSDGEPEKFYGHRISIELSNATVADAIRFIIEESGANIIMSNIPARQISFKLRNIPWDQALTILMKANGLGYTRQGDVLIIRPLDDIKNDIKAKLILRKNKLMLK